MLKRHKSFMLLFLIFLTLLFAGIKAGSYIGTKSSKNHKMLSMEVNKKHIKALNNTKLSRYDDMDMYDNDKKERHKEKVEETRKKLEEDNRKLNDAKNSTTTQVVDKPVTPSEKIAYLTFDDGPSEGVTPQVLDVLKKNNIKATFFVLGKEAEKNKQLVKRIVAEGHILANHTYCHDEKILYSSPESFIADIHKCENVIKSIIPEYNCKLIRFPYGSRKFASKATIEAVINSGYHYADWNCLSRDAEIANASPEVLFNEVKRSSFNKFKLVVLMHDTVPNTAVVLPRVIDYLKAQGYSFKTLQ